MLGFDALAKLPLAAVPVEVANDLVGEAAVTLDGIGFTAAATIDLAGSASITLDTIVPTATGTIDITGASSVTLADLGLALTGTLDNNGALAVTLDDVTRTSTGALDVQAAASVTLDAISFTAEGQNGTTGILATTLDSVALTAAGVLTLVGSSAVSFDTIGLSAAATITLSGQADILLGSEQISETQRRAPRAVLALGIEKQVRRSSTTGLGLSATGVLLLQAESSTLLDDIGITAQAYFGGHVYEPAEGLVQDAPNFANLVATPGSFGALVQDAARFTELTRPGW